MIFKNVIILTLDGLRYDWIEKLPFLSNLVNKSVFFDKMITYAPYSVASSNALLSGIYGLRNGVDNYYGAKNFNNKFKPIYEILKQNGFYTALVTSKHLDLPKGELVDEFIKFENDVLVEDSISIIKKSIFKAKNSGKRFFIFINHTDWFNHQYIERAKKQDTLKDDYFKYPEGNASIYHECFKRHDIVAKEVYTLLENENMLDDTLLIILADHGASTGQKWGETIYGVYCFDYTLRVFCYLLNNQLEKRKINYLIRNVDILPTILELMNISCDNLDLMDGYSFTNLLNGKVDNRISFSETGGLGGPTPSPKKPNVHAITTNDWKFIYNSTTEIKQLYYIPSDPKEEINLVMKHPEVVEKLWEKMQFYLNQRIKE